MRVLYECTHNTAEGAGAAAVAAIVRDRNEVRGRKVAAVLSGGNVDRSIFCKVLSGAPLEP
jgi:threonine dehydratase